VIVTAEVCREGREALEAERATDPPQGSEPGQKVEGHRTPEGATRVRRDGPS
jgi:hypothetical protein